MQDRRPPAHRRARLIDPVVVELAPAYLVVTDLTVTDLIVTALIVTGLAPADLTVTAPAVTSPSATVPCVPAPLRAPCAPCRRALAAHCRASPASRATGRADCSAPAW